MPIRLTLGAERLWRIGLLISVLFVLIPTVPWTEFENHSDWRKVRWMPFRPSGPARDLAANVVLYLPLGLCLGFLSRRPLTAAALTALVLSTLAEYTQIFTHTRIPSTTDVAMNVAGALVGVAGARVVAKGQRREAA